MLENLASDHAGKVPCLWMRQISNLFIGILFPPERGALPSNQGFEWYWERT